MSWAKALSREGDRAGTFAGWKNLPSDSVTPEGLAAAGFFYNPGHGCPDRCTCFVCGVSLVQWDVNDDPLVEHMKHSPACTFARTASKQLLASASTGVVAVAAAASSSSSSATGSNSARHPGRQALPPPSPALLQRGGGGGGGGAGYRSYPVRTAGLGLRSSSPPQAPSACRSAHPRGEAAAAAQALLPLSSAKLGGGSGGVADSTETVVVRQSPPMSAAACTARNVLFSHVTKCGSSAWHCSQLES